MTRGRLAYLGLIAVFWGSLVLGAWAGPEHRVLMGELLAIAEPDQLEAYHQLHLSRAQEVQLEDAARELAPRVEQMRGAPGGPLMLLPEIMQRVDRILTPEQRPLARRLVPRPHQWARVMALWNRR